MKTMVAVPRLDVWMVRPRCSGPARVVARGVPCTEGTWHADGAAPGHWRTCGGT